MFCILVVAVWAPSILVLPNVDTWQLIINTATTIITFLMVALLQNTQRRADDAIQDKLNAIAQALDKLGRVDSSKDAEDDEVGKAVGLEDRESA